jgi:uncharacterized membrane protein YeaQ/YmgE (transglycosylase-associated protein family)
MRASDPIVTFLLVLVIGVIAGILFDRLAGPSWLARQFSGSTRGILTSALVGVAGAFVGYHIAMLAFVGGLVTSVIAAAAGAAVVLFVWRKSALTRASVEAMPSYRIILDIGACCVCVFVREKAIS